MIETSYRGYRIHYSENEDVWRSSDLNAEAITLTALKQKMSRLILKARKESGGGIPALHLSSYNKVYKPVEIVGRAGISSWDRTPYVWYMGPGTDGKVTRQKDGITSFAAPTPENVAALEAIRALDKTISEMTRKKHDDLKAIPRLSEADLGALVPDD